MTQWVQDVRSVTSDGLAERAAIDYLYANNIAAFVSITILL